jgi:hypothetical protein
VLSRPSSSNTFPSSIKVVRSDYSPDSLQAAFAGQDAVISMVNGPGFSEQLKLVDAAIAAGVRRFIPSEYGCNTADERVRNMVPVFVGKRKVVDYLISREDEISWTAVISGLLADHVSSNASNLNRSLRHREGRCLQEIGTTERVSRLRS